jgi:hypothetical protein
MSVSEDFQQFIQKAGLDRHVIPTGTLMKFEQQSVFFFIILFFRTAGDTPADVPPCTIPY